MRQELQNTHFIRIRRPTDNLSKRGTPMTIQLKT